MNCPNCGHKRKVFICSPYAGEVERNVELARRLCKRAIDEGFAPFAAHLIYPGIIYPNSTDEKSPEGRELGIKIGLSFLAVCDELWYCRDFGISMGMEDEIEEAKRLHIRRRMFVGIMNGRDVAELSSQKLRRYMRGNIPMARRQRGKRLCRWCGGEVPKGSRAWCSAECVHDYMERTSYGVQCARARDGEVCQVCGRKDTSGAIDHIVPVWKGGGSCGIDNLQWLCNNCHKQKTADEARVRALRKANN